LTLIKGWGISKSTKYKILSLALLLSLGTLVNAQSQGGGSNNVGWTPIGYTGPFEVSAPTQLTMSRTDLESLTYSIHDWDLFEQGETQSSRHNTYPAISMSISNSDGVKIVLTTNDGTGRESIEEDLGWIRYYGVKTVNADPGYYTVHITVTDEFTPQVATDPGVHHEYVTVVVN